jgi:hypothetical protein
MLLAEPQLLQVVQVMLQRCTAKPQQSQCCWLALQQITQQLLA